jgi:hypothetical protein
MVAAKTDIKDSLEKGLHILKEYLSGITTLCGKRDSYVLTIYFIKE